MIKNAAVRAFATLATAAALIGGSAVGASASVPRPAPEPTVTLDPRPFPVPFPLPTLRPVRYPTLYDVDTDTRRGCDVVTFRFRGDAPDVDVQYVRALRETPSRRLVRLPGPYLLLVTFDDARTRGLVRGTQYDSLRELRAHRLLGDYRGTVTVGLGVRHRHLVDVRTVGDDVVLRLCHRPFPFPYENDDA